MSYDNFDLIINQALHGLLRDEFDLPIVFEPEFKEEDIATKGEYVRFYPDGSSSEERLTNMDIRNYRYNLIYYSQYSGDQQKKRFEKIVSDRVNHLYYFLLSNSSYQVDGYKWTTISFGDITGVIYGIDEEFPEIAHVDMELIITRRNEIPNSPALVAGGDIV